MWDVVVGTICLVVGLMFAISTRHIMSLSHIPGPKPSWVLGNIPALIKFCRNPPEFNSSAYFTHLTETHGPVYRLFFAPLCFRPIVMVSSPAAVQEVLIRNSKKSAGYNIFRAILGDGLITASPQIHKPRRRLLDGAFHARYLKQSIFGAMVSLTDEFLTTIQGRMTAQSQECTIDVGKELNKFTMDVICVCGFDIDPKLRIDSDQPNEYANLVVAWNRVLKELTQRLRNPLRDLFAPRIGLQYRRDIRYIRKQMGVIIQSRLDRLKQGEAPGTDLLSVLLQADPPLSIKDITDEVTTFNLAGQDTTGLLISWSLYHLALDQEMQNHCHREAVAVLAGQSTLAQDPAPADVPHIEAVLRECLRFYPPASGISREFDHDVELDGFKVPANTEIAVSIATLGRIKSLWGEDANVWRPTRFLEEGRLKPVEECAPSQMAYIPFSVGARSCIGRHFAAMEARIVLVMLLNRLELGPAPEMTQHPGLVQETTLKPARPILVRVRARQTAKS